MHPGKLIDGRWQTCHYESLLQQTWDEETFVFNPASGHTHLLNPVAMTLLEYLATTPSDLAGLAAWLGVENNPQAQHALVEQFEQLILTGLICPA